MTAAPAARVGHLGPGWVAAGSSTPPLRVRRPVSIHAITSVPLWIGKSARECITRKSPEPEPQAVDVDSSDPQIRRPPPQLVLLILAQPHTDCHHPGPEHAARRCRRRSQPDLRARRYQPLRDSSFSCSCWSWLVSPVSSWRARADRSADQRAHDPDPPCAGGASRRQNVSLAVRRPQLLAVRRLDAL